MPRTIFSFFDRVIRESVGLYWVLLKIMVPVMVAVKVAAELGVIGIASAVFEPLMGLVGLPQEMGLVWATAFLLNIYGSIGVLLGILPEVEITVAQMTVLSSLILIAHSIPIEQRVCQKAGANFVFTSLLRFVGALVYGVVLNALYTSLDVLQQPLDIAWLPEATPEGGVGGWVLKSAQSLATIFLVIVALIALLRLMDAVGLTRLISRTFAPFLSLMGIGPATTPLTMIGVLLGLTYGSGLIIKEARTGTLPPRDILLSLAFMALCHSLIEDTLLMMAFGAHWSGVLVGRFLFSLLVVAVMGRVVHALPEQTFRRFLFRSPAPDPVPVAASTS